MDSSVNRTKKSFFQVATEFAKRPFGFRFLILQPTIKTLSWIEIIRGLSQSALIVKKNLRHTNHAVKWLDAPAKFKTYLNTLVQLKTDLFSRSVSRIGDSAAKSYIQTVNILDLFAVTVKMFSERKLLTLTLSQVKIIRGIGVADGFGLVLFGARGIKTQVEILSREQSIPSEKKLALIRLAKSVFLIAMGIVITVAFTVVNFVASWVFLTLSTAIVASILLGHFYEELVVKEEMNSNKNACALA